MFSVALAVIVCQSAQESNYGGPLPLPQESKEPSLRHLEGSCIAASRQKQDRGIFLFFTYFKNPQQNTIKIFSQAH